MAVNSPEEKEPTRGEPETVSEWSIEQVLASEEDLKQAQETSKYHFSQEELQHKRDRIDKADESESG